MRITNKVTRAVEIYRDQGLLSLVDAMKRFLSREFWTSRTGIQLHWLRRLCVLRRWEGGWFLQDLRKGEKFYFPHLADHGRYSLDHRKRRKEAYYISDFVSVNEGDVVFDVGAYVGVTSLIIADEADTVYAIEPSPRALECLKKNTSTHENIQIIEKAAWKESTQLSLRFGKAASEDSLIDPDDGGMGEEVTVEAQTIADIASQASLDRIDFLKVEAEGVEPEIVTGIDGFPVSKVASTGNEERGGKTTYEEVHNVLREMGYSVNVDKSHPYKMVYGAFDSDDGT